jgi:hypothetical protein
MELCDLNLEQYIQNYLHLMSPLPESTSTSSISGRTAPVPRFGQFVATEVSCDGRFCPSRPDRPDVPIPPTLRCAVCYDINFCEHCNNAVMRGEIAALAEHTRNHTLIGASGHGFPVYRHRTLNHFGVTLDATWQIASGLEYIHKQGEVHRDLKPSNSTLSLSFRPLINSPLLAQGR